MIAGNPDANIAPFGAVLVFDRRGMDSADKRVERGAGVIVRMSVEHLKAMVFILWKQVGTLETKGLIRYDLPKQLMDELKYDDPTWRAFWYGEADGNTNGQLAEAAPTKTEDV